MQNMRENMRNLLTDALKYAEFIDRCAKICRIYNAEYMRHISVHRRQLMTKQNV